MAGMDLKTFLSGVLTALSNAKYLGDLESKKFMERYQKENMPFPFTVPAFQLAEVELEIRFVTAENGEKPAMEPEIKLELSPAVLAKLQPYQVNTMKLKFAPLNIKVFQEEGGKNESGYP